MMTEIEHFAAKSGVNHRDTNVQPAPEIEQHLLARRAELINEVREKMDALRAERLPDEEDRVAAAHEQLVSGQLTSLAQGELRQVEAAIERLKGGTYGRCESCGRPIAPARLAAVPWTLRCIPCEESTESG
jgi:RNA polymerase-binding transcription factor